ncbi:MAG TPA: pantoate--beta-alanine ligase [Anaeromyxobacteraceae bacterium]|nr:pantoate--beta-alanine ligase [Anaeromyxobacteraceae bacterium]
MIELIKDPREWQRRCVSARLSGRCIALVPTMGALHEGHLSLLREARRRADEGRERGLALATIFVNPTQFGPSEDLSRYPRDLDGDLARCAVAGIDWVLAPERPEAVYAREHETWIEVERSSQGLCGARRPGHFRGVATVVAKLFNLSQPHLAFFGEKDWQQLQVIRAMVRDLDFAIEVVGLPIVRDPDGLALSSRNAYLSADERRRALALPAALRAVRDLARDGQREREPLLALVRRTLEEGGLVVDYVELVDAALRPAARAERGTRLLGAVFAGATRLIDNVAIP